MAADHKNGMQCSEFDALLSEALDQRLSGEKLESFQAHARGCPTCGPLLAEADAGLRWLHELVEVEPPVTLVDNILAATSGLSTARLHGTANAQAQPSWFDRLQDWANQLVTPILGVLKQPRFAMSFGMAFFALSVALSVLGVKPADLRSVSLRPAAVRHTYYNTQARVVRYYENIRLVYEMESRLREFKRTMAPAEPNSEAAPEKTKDHKNDTTEQPEQKQERNYSQTDGSIILASAPLGPSVNESCLIVRPVVSVTTYRRLV